MTKTLGGREEMEREGLKKQNRKGIIYFPKSLDFILYMVGDHYKSFRQAHDMINFVF